MLILSLRTDKPEAEVGLFDDDEQLVNHSWQAHRHLAETIHTTIKEQLDKLDKQLADIRGVVVYKGPGSFTGLRIGLTVANTLATGLKVPIVAENGDGWQQNGIKRLLNSEDEKLAQPEYGALPHITVQKK